MLLELDKSISDEILVGGFPKTETSKFLLFKIGTFQPVSINDGGEFFFTLFFTICGAPTYVAIILSCIDIYHISFF